MKNSHNIWLAAWYGKARWVYCLLPVSWLFRLISLVRKGFIVKFLQKKLTAPVIVVGNISIGGTGKTPLIIELVKYLQQQGHKPGVVSRGYGGFAQYPYVLNQYSVASISGDEPLLIYQATQCAVCVAPDRVAAAALLIAQGCTHILSDDGLQHYRLGRDLEIAVVDGQRAFGNQQVLPVGPLREPVSRLKSVDLIVVNSRANNTIGLEPSNFYDMNIQPLAWRKLPTMQELPLAAANFKAPIHALAGIGNPERFFKTLDGLGLVYSAHRFADHHHFSAKDFESYGDHTIVMTEKDAIKCHDFAKPEWYSLVVGAHLSEEFWRAFQHKLDSV